MTTSIGIILAANLISVTQQLTTNHTDIVDLIVRSRWGEVDQALAKIKSFPESKFKDDGETVIGFLCTYAGRSDLTGNVLKGMRLLYEHRANPSGDHGVSMFHASRLDQWGEVTERLIQYGVNPNAKCSMNPSFEGIAPLFLAADYNKSSKAAGVLLTHGADPNTFSLDPERPQSDLGPMTPIMIAALRNNPGIVAALIKFKAKVNLSNPSSGMTALHYAAKANASESIRALLKSGANKKLKDKKGRTPLVIAKLAKAKQAIVLLK